LKITFVVPTYNEAENIPNLVAAVMALPLENLNLLVVDDNSPDGTGQIAEDLSRQYQGRVQVMHRAGKQGLGTAYIQGFQRCILDGSEAVGQMDADFSHPIDKIIPMAQAVEKCDIAMGSRYIPGGSVDENWPLWRKGLSAWGNFYARTILGLPMRDVTGGFRLWRSTTLENMPLDRIRSNGYVFQVEMAYVAHLLGYRSLEVPIYFADRRWGQSKMSFKIQMEAAVRVWQLPGIYRNLKESSGVEPTS
jgi:dolichol-phosphate mannosyltransferase